MGMTVHHRTLASGLQLWLSPNPEEPRFVARVVVRAGSAHDPPEQTGVAHQLEHVAANKGGAELLRGEVKALVGLLGGSGMNAFTGTDRTSYLVDLPASRLGAWAAIEADRMAAPVTEDGFESEMEVIREEKKRALDDPGRALSETFARTMFGGHPYAVPILGEPEHLVRPSVDALRTFHRTWYRPSNMALVLAGDFDVEQVGDELAERFGGLEDGPRPDATEPSGWVPSDRADEVRVEVSHRGPPALRVGWPGVRADDLDREALRLAVLALSNGRTGNIDRHLLQQQRVRSAGASSWAGRFGGTFVLSAAPREGQTLAEAEALVREQVVRLLDGDLDEARLAATLLNLEAGELRQLEDNGSRVTRMMGAFVSRRSWTDVEGTLDRMCALTAEQVIEVARRHLSGPPVVVWRTTGEPTRPSLEAPPAPREALPEGRSARFETIASSEESPRPPQVLTEGTDYVRSSGPGGRTVRNANPFSDLSQVGVRWLTGSEDAPTRGFAFALWRLGGIRGGPGRTEFEGALHDRAGSVQASVGRYHTDLVVRAPASRLAEVIALAGRRLEAPAIERDVRRAHVTDVVARRAQARPTRPFAASGLRAFARRGARSALLELRLPDANVLALADADPTGALDRYRSLPRTTVATVPEGFDLTAALAPLGVAEDAEGPVPPPIHYLCRDRPTVLLLHHDSAQATVGFHLPAGPWSRAGLAARSVWAQYVGGGAGVVFREIRELRGLAYSARGGLSGGWRPGDDDLVHGEVTCDPDKAVEVATLLPSLLPVPPFEGAAFEQARRSALTKTEQGRVTFRSVGWTVERWHLRGLLAEGDPRVRLREELRSVSVDDVRAWCEPLAEVPPTISIVGDLTRMDRGALAALGEVREMTLDELVV